MRYKCIVSYDGYNYMGFQVQDNEITIELCIENALKKMLGDDIKIYPSGRTDRYVHAIAQVFHFDYEKDLPDSGIKRGINAFLPDDIHIMDVKHVDDSFHSRFSAKSKEYRYYINIGEYNPLTIRYMPNITNLDVDKMDEAIKLFIGTHNFKGFASAQIDERKDTVKTIYDAHINRLDDKLEFVFIGTGFLKYQIRRMMGILIDIGRGFSKKEMILDVLEKCDPKISHKVAPGCGLYLYKVNYEDYNG